MMKRLLLISLIVLCVALPCFAGGGKEKAGEEGVITDNATFDPSKVTEIQTDKSVLVTVKLDTSDTADQITRAMVNDIVEEYKSRDVEINAEQALNVLVSQSLISQFLTPLAASYTEEEINTIVVNSIVQTASQYGYSVSDEEQAKQFVETLFNMSLNEYANALMAELLLEQYCRENFPDSFANVTDATDEEINEVYNSNSELFNVNASARVAHVFMKFGETEADNESILATMNQIRKRLAQRGLTFEEAVVQFSEDPSSSSNGGLINGWLTDGSQIGIAQLGQNALDAVFALKIGQISDVVEGVIGYHIFKLVSLRPAGLLSLDDAYDLNSNVTVKEYIASSVKSLKDEVAFADAYQKLLAQLEKRAEIRYTNSL